MLDKVYMFYLNVMSFKKAPLHESERAGSKADLELIGKLGEHVNPDAEATRIGNYYRSVGILVGILGVAIVFAAVAPIGLGIQNELWLQFFGVCKVLMMLAVLLLVLFVRRSALKSKWISLRREAEKRRYEKLSRLKSQLQEADPTVDDAKAVWSELQSQMSGQIEYNENKAEKYKAIEHLSVLITWVGFAIASLCAIWLLLSEFHLAPHFSALIFGTAFLPALVGGIHGINGFLNIGGLAEEHAKMASSLKVVKQTMADIGVLERDDPIKVLMIANDAYTRLVDRDTQWAESAAKQHQINPA